MNIHVLRFRYCTHHSEPNVPRQNIELSEGSIVTVEPTRQNLQPSLIDELILIILIKGVRIYLETLIIDGIYIRCEGTCVES